MSDTVSEMTSDKVASHSLVVMSEGGQVLPEAADDQVSVKQIGQLGLFWIRFRRHKAALAGSALLLLIIIVAVIGPLITPEQPLRWNYVATNWAPQGNFRYLFGTDQNGHSVMMKVLLGAGPSLEVGFLAAACATVMGVLAGAIAGYFGGLVDAVVMRVTDVFLTLPFLPVLIVAQAVLAKGGIGFIILIFGVLGWAGVARLIRA